MLGSDDVLACFVAGNAFTWDDWFRQKTSDDSLQPSIDLLLNVAVFVWFGAVCPWRSFAYNNVIPIYRLIPLAILVFLFRRPPIIAVMHTRIHQFEHWRQAIIVGFFGPIGVSAIFYLYISQEYLRTSVLDDQGNQREDAVRLAEIMMVVIWFLVICSVVSVFPHIYDCDLSSYSINCFRLYMALPFPSANSESTFPVLCQKQCGLSAPQVRELRLLCN